MTTAVTTDFVPVSKIRSYVALTKPRIIELLLITTIPTMIVAQRGMPPVWLMAITLVGGTLAAGGANAINMVIDRDIDSVMHRTRKRPLVTGSIAPRNALIFAISLEVIAAALFWTLVNPLSALLALSATAFYVFVYTIWLKRTSPQNIVIGGAAGAVPVLIGWSSVTGRIGWAPIVLFAMIFIWTPPHFWALAIRYRDDYAAANVPMLPVVRTFDETARQIVFYTGLLWALSLVLAPVAHLGLIYTASAFVLGAMFQYGALDLLLKGSPERSMRLFGFSITYVTVLFAAMAIDQLAMHAWHV